MLRKIIGFALIAALGISAVAQAGESKQDQQNLNDEHILPTGGDSWTPWPWSASMPFPWSDIEGSWRVEHGEFISYFSLRVLMNRSTDIPQLAIRQYDGDTCRLLSKGVGYERNNKIYAQMTSKAGTLYRVEFTAFDKEDSPEPPLRGSYPSQAVMVVSMGLLDYGSIEDMSHMQIVKISRLMTQDGCKQDLSGKK